jgi:hypothetical protein
MMEKRTKEEKASSTAGYTCFFEGFALHVRKANDIVERIPWRKYSCPGFAKVILNVPFLRKAFMGKVAPSGIYEYVIARTKIIGRNLFGWLSQSGYPDRHPGREGYQSLTVPPVKIRNKR